MGLDEDKKNTAPVIVSRDELRIMILEECKKHRTKSDFARSIEVYPSFLQNVLGGTKGPGTKILEHFGLEEQVLYVRKSQAQRSGED